MLNTCYILQYENRRDENYPPLLTIVQGLCHAIGFFEIGKTSGKFSFFSILLSINSTFRHHVGPNVEQDFSRQVNCFSECAVLAVLKWFFAEGMSQTLLAPGSRNQNPSKNVNAW